MTCLTSVGSAFSVLLIFSPQRLQANGFPGLLPLESVEQPGATAQERSEDFAASVHLSLIFTLLLPSWCFKSQ